MPRIRTLLLSALFACLAQSAWASHSHHRYSASGAPEMGISTGPKGGTYIAFGYDISRIAAKVGLIIRVYESNGSIENIARITSKQKMGLAIVQSNVLGYLSHSKDADSIAVSKKLRLVAPFYNEEVHILARRNIASLADLTGKRVVVGSQGSGSMLTAVNLFSALGITPPKMYEVDPSRGAMAVLENEADAMVFVGGKPVKLFKNMEALADVRQGPNAGRLSDVHFLPINDDRLLKEYKPATLSHDDYSFIGADVPTVAVTALLVSYDYTMKNEAYYHEQCRNMAKLAHALQDNLADLKAHGHPKWKEVDLNADVGQWKRDSCSEAVFEAAKKAEPAPAQTPPAAQQLPLEKDLLGIAVGGGAGQ